MYVNTSVADTVGLQWFQLKPPLKSKCTSNHSVNYTKDAESSATITTLPAKHGMILERYKSVYQHLDALDLYQPLFLNKIAPEERFVCRKWLSELQLPFPVMLYKYAYGNNFGTTVFACKNSM